MSFYVVHKFIVYKNGIERALYKPFFFSYLKVSLAFAEQAATLRYS